MHMHSHIVFEKFAHLIPYKENMKCRVNNEFLIIMSNDKELYYLNDTARFIYECFDGEKTLSEIFDVLIKEYAIESEMKEAVLEDFVETIRNFQWQNIIRLKEAKNERV